MALDLSKTEKKNGSVTFTACTSGGKAIQLRLESLRVVWEPSVYGGDASEIRKTSPSL